MRSDITFPDLAPNGSPLPDLLRRCKIWNARWQLLTVPPNFLFWCFFSILNTSQETEKVDLDSLPEPHEWRFDTHLSTQS